MDRDHSRIIIFLLGGILAVLLFGREVALGSVQTIFWVGLVVGIVWLIFWAIIATIRFLKRESVAYRDEVRRDREEGRPWLYTFVAWPGIIANFGVFGLAAYSRHIEGSCRALTGDCLREIPFWWLPVCLLLGSIPIMWLEKLFNYFRDKEL
ncbi:MAG: hypothetical protein KF794_08985 [Xanthobacteraceae bacterium]|nr:hypothetical protein [Xanthobacteraceae bacterium]QYK43936.1 MAG: hypothetical protein KF794_08985 [Xanthobacteraceae bacterium]